MIRRLILAAPLLALFAAPASAQFAIIGPTQPTADNGDRLATTAWVNNFFATGIPLASGKIFVGSAGNVATAQTMSGDCTLVASGVITCTQSAGGFTVNGALAVTGGELLTNIAAPSTPAAGKTQVYVDATQKILSAKNDAGTVSNTVVPSTCAANQFGTSVSAAGVFGCTQPAITNISGLGTGATTALAINVGLFGSFVTMNGVLGTPSSGTGTNITGLPISTGVSGLGTGVATALGVNVGSAGAPVLFNGAGGTPSSLTLTNATGLPATGLTGTLQAAQEPAHSGDATNSAGSLAMSVTKTGGVSFGPYATAAQGQLPGIASNTAATAGNIGEHVSATVNSGSAVSLTTVTTVNLTSISLTAGEWDVSGSAYFTTAASTNIAFLYASSSPTTLTLSGTPGQYVQQQLNFVPGAGVNTLNLNPFRFSLSGTTTIFFTIQGSFTVSTLTVFGYLRATRIH